MLSRTIQDVNIRNCKSWLFFTYNHTYIYAVYIYIYIQHIYSTYIFIHRVSISIHACIYQIIYIKSCKYIVYIRICELYNTLYIVLHNHDICIFQRDIVCSDVWNDMHGKSINKTIGDDNYTYIMVSQCPFIHIINLDHALFHGWFHPQWLDAMKAEYIELWIYAQTYYRTCKNKQAYVHTFSCMYICDLV